MKYLLEAGKYVVAVSGGVDSVVLLHRLAQQPELDLVVAHLDHGIRTDSAEDAAFVAGLARNLGLAFFTRRVELGPNASEALARKHRYEFLNQVREEEGAIAVVTAHHQDDVIETAILNMLRGTKRKGFVSLTSTEMLKRPLLHMTKAELREYAKVNQIEWREDSTNTSMNYLRNRVRAILSSNLTGEDRQKIVAILTDIDVQNQEINEIVNSYLRNGEHNRLVRAELNKMSLAEAYEVVAAWLRNNNTNFDKKTIERIVIGSRTLYKGAQIDVQNGRYCLLSREEIILTDR